MDSASLNTISLCSGVAMLDEGVHAGLEFMGIRSRTILFAEREAFPVSILAARMEEGSLAAAPIWFGDFTELPAGRFRGLVDGVVAGFPCQDLSVAGRRAGLDGKRSGLFFNVCDIADESGAWFMLLENVAGIASAAASVVDETSTTDYAAKSDGDGFSDVGIEDGRLLERAAARVMGELADRGWNAEWITLSASDVGASHGRARWFCFAWRMDDASRNGRNGLDREVGRGRGVLETGYPVDDAESIGRHERWAEPARQQGGSDVAEYGVAVANAERPRRAQAGSGCEVDAGREPESGCIFVANPSSTRLSGRQDVGTGRSDAQQGARRIELERGSAELADANSAGLRAIRLDQGRASDAESISGSSMADAIGARLPQRVSRGGAL